MSAKKTKKSRAEKNLENIGEALTTTEQFLEKNRKSILIGLLVVIAIVGIFLAYHYLHKTPKNNEAQSAIFKGERYFQNGQDSIALFGNGNDYIGFEAIINQYKRTKTADLAHAYAGLSYNRLGNHEKALEQVRKFKGGDVYLKMGRTEEAISQYLKAARQADDNMLSPIYYKKAGQGYLHLGNFDQAIKTFTMIKDEYINSPEGQEADKYIKQAELLKESN